MSKKHNSFLWCLFLVLVVTAPAGADEYSSAEPARSRMISKVKQIESPRIVYVESSPTLYFSEAGANEAEKNINQPSNKWQAQAVVDVPAPGLVESALIPELHQAIADKGGSVENQLDIRLLGPDGKARSFELFWREKGQPETVLLEKTNVRLVEDRLLQWEGLVPEDFVVNKIIVDIADKDYVGRVDVEATADDSDWSLLVKDAALYKNDRTRQADIPIKEGVYERFRLTFQGYDKKYGDTPLFVSRVQAVGARSGRDYEKTSFQPDYNEATNDRATEVRVTLPGSGIWISDIKIKTEAIFQGTWELGREKVVLGKREFSAIKTDNVSYVGDNKQTLFINVDQWWPDQTLVVRMTSGDFFGRIQAVDVQARIPRLFFFADTAGRYIVQAGGGNRKRIFGQAPVRDRKVDHVAVFSDIIRNPRNVHDRLIEKYNITGGPFNQAGYAWNANVRVEEPGFYRVKLNERVCLEEKLPALRLARGGNQVPCFLGSEEKRHTQLETNREYDADNNRSVFTIRLPFASPHWSAVRLSAEGLFERTLEFQKHTPGMIGWQPWKTRSWVSRQDQKTDFLLELTDFPQDQDEIRLIIDHGDDQPLDIYEITAVYSARDLFFLASAPGTYKLFGGNPDAPPVSYKDFEMIKDELMAAAPKQVIMGEIQTIMPGEETSLAGKDVGGGPFDGSGYTWSSPLDEITKPGFYQLLLNQKVSLENNRQGLRLVRSNHQVPFFMGGLRQKQVELTAEKKYDREKNETTWLVSLPQPSVHWRQLRLFADGVFSRIVVFEFRKPGNTGWQPWRRVEWKNRHTGEAVLESPLSGFPIDQTDIRLVMRHGDNKPLEIKKVEAVYTTQDMFFIAGQRDGYKLVGGNHTASAPTYDLALIKDHILKKEPIKISMDETEVLKPAGWKRKISHTFSEQGWGLYFVLGLVTLILLVVIVRLFPKEQD